MKILIFSGGTGSQSLQEGLHYMYSDMIESTIVTNAYDNGLSTGVVRKVLKGKILGPSDLRKNQLYQVKLKGYNSGLNQRFIDFLNKRISADTSIEMSKLINKELDSIADTLSREDLSSLGEAIDAFFDEEDSRLFSYNDFSISNIIYAGLAKNANYSLDAAGVVMERILNLPKQKVLLSSDKSLFLQAVTESGKTIWDEGDIVQWSNPDNKISKIKLVDNKGKECIPELTAKVKKKIKDADIIIFSSGTQWSSLIPTYVHKDFYKILDKAKAKKYLVMNNVPDFDMFGIDSIGVVDILKSYIPLDDTTIVYNEAADKTMLKVHPDYKSLVGDFKHDNPMIGSYKANMIHDGYTLVKSIMIDYYNSYVENDFYVFDFDGTVVGRGESFAKESEFNINSFRKLPQRHTTILTGNSLNHINSKINGWYICDFIYCDGGNSYCEWDQTLQKFVFKRYVDPKHVLSLKEIETLYNHLIDIDVPVYKIENRNDMIISIKPLSPINREKVHKKMVDLVGKDYDIHMNGRTTIDIFKKGYNKTVVFSDPRFKDMSIFYAGDELESGNDAPIRKLKDISFFPVKDPKDTSTLIKTMIEK